MLEDAYRKKFDTSMRVKERTGIRFSDDSGPGKVTRAPLVLELLPVAVECVRSVVFESVG